MLKIRGSLVALFALSAVVAPRAAHAGPVEEVIQLAANPAKPEELVLRYQYSGDGLLYSHDGGETFALVCSASVKEAGMPPSQGLGPIALAGDGTLMMGVFGGMWLDDGNGCGWSREASLEGKWISDIALHPTDPEVSFAISSSGGKENGIFRRNADGSVTELGVKKDQLLTRIRVAELPGGGLRIYESAVNGQLEKETDGGIEYTPNFALRVSDDEGATWTEHVIGEVDGTLRLEAIDPSNPDRIVLSIARDREMGAVTAIPDSVIVTDDLGETMTEWLSITDFGGIAFGEDGEVWIGDRGDTMTDAPKGIWHAASLGDEPSQLTDAFGVTCLHNAGDKLFACQRFGFGTVDKASGEYTASMRLPMLETMNQCDGVDMGATCRQQLCMGYCGLGHFPDAPMCVAAYDSNDEVGCQQLVSTPDAGGGMAGSAGVGASGGMGGSANPPPDAGMEADAGTPPDAGDEEDGCAVASPGAHGASRGSSAWLIAAVALCALIRTRSKRSKRSMLGA